MYRTFTIIKKELRDLVRDRRTMFFMVVFPAVIIPFLIGGVSKLTISIMKKEMDKTLTIAIVGGEYDSSLVEFISNQDKLILITTISEHEIKSQILDEIIDAAIVIPNNVREYLSEKKQVELKHYFRSGKGENIN